MQELKFKLYSARRKLLMLLCFITIIVLTFSTKAFAKSGEDYDNSKAELATTKLPFYTSGPTWGSSSVSFSLATAIDSGSTDNCSKMGHSHPHYYRGRIALWVNADESNEQEIAETSYRVSASGTAYSEGDSRSFSLPYGDLTPYIEMKTISDPSITSRGFSNGQVYASASGARKQGSTKLELCVYVDDWSGPGDNDVPPYLEPSGRWADDDRYKTITVTDTDPIEYYYYTFDNSSYQYKVNSGYYGQGSYFNSPVSTSNAGQYCHVTFYTESGAYVSTVIPIPNLVTLYYNANGGTGAPSSQSVWPGQSVYISSQKPTRTNYEFLGWNTSSAYGDLQYGASVPSGTITSGSVTLYEDKTLYAVWRTVKVPYTLQFRLNGKVQNNDYAYVTGTVNGKQTVSNSRSFSALEVPGYTVSASVKSSDSSVFIINSGNSAKSTDFVYNIPTKTIKTATTDIIECGTIHTVKYDANGGNYGKDAAGNPNKGPEEQTKYYGTNIKVTEIVPNKLGYEFTGWKSSQNAITYQKNAPYSYSQRGGVDTLVAQWKPITYTIHFERNTPPGSITEVTGTMKDISQTYDVTDKLPKNQFKLTGCDFQGWNTKADGSGDSYKDEASIKNLTSVKGDTIILYAQWKVTYKVIGSLNDITSDEFTDGNGIPYGTVTEGKMIRTNAVAKFKDGDCDGDGRLTQDDINLIAKYLSNEVTPTEQQKVAMDVNGDGQITMADKNMVQQLIEDLTLTSSKKNIFTLMPTKFLCYDYPGYKASASVKCSTDDVYIMGINNEKYNNVSTRNVTISEKTINSTYSDIIRFGTIHTITFDPNDVTKGNGSTKANNVPEDITKYYDHDVTIPNAPDRDGYIFNGYLSDKQDELYKPGDKYSYAQRGGEDTLIAQWTPITYTITFDKNKPDEATTDVLYSMDNIGATFDVPQNLPKNKYKLAGWVFQGWNTKADGTGDFYLDEAEVVNLTIVDKSVVTLYAQWKNIDAGSPDTDNSGRPNYHGLVLNYNNNGLIYGLSEEINSITTDANGNILKLDNPNFKYNTIVEMNYSTTNTADKNISIYKNDDNKYSYYKMNTGDSYIETKDDGSRILHKFVGWSVYKYATKSQTPEIIHTENSINNSLNLIYEYQAVNDLRYNESSRPSNDILNTKAQGILNKKEELLNTATDITDRKIMIYAIWDEYPLMQVKDIAFLSDDFANIQTEDRLKQEVLKKIENSIVEDKEDGNWNKGTNRDITVSLDQVSLVNAYDVLQKRYKAFQDGETIYSSTGSSSVNVTVIDKTGNVTVQIINVWINASNPIIKEDPGNADNDTSVFKPVTSYVRAIDKNFYSKSEKDGGLLTNSLWKTNEEYKNELTNTFEILEKDTGYDQIWRFTRDDVKYVQEYIQTNGLGNSDNLNALCNFLKDEKIAKCRIQ